MGNAQVKLNLKFRCLLVCLKDHPVHEFTLFLTKLLIEQLLHQSQCFSQIAHYHITMCLDTGEYF